MASNDPRRFLDYLTAERNAAALYRALACTVEGDRREALLELADIEEKHADHWVAKLAESGIDAPPLADSLDPDDAELLRRARSLGIDGILEILEQTESAAEGMYDDEPEALASMSTDEREHAATFRQMRADQSTAVLTPRKALSPGVGEPWHRVDRSGSMRAAVFGVSDGLVSNTALVMGFAGAAPNNSTILFAGLAGLLAGAFSMAAGEYVSVASQRDLFRREIEMEATELREKPEEEQKELELIYRAKGLSREQSAVVAAQIMKDPAIALETLAREELGLDPSELGNPVKVAASSFISFAIGASVVVLPYLLFTGPTASTSIPLMLAIALSLISMVVVGGVVGRLSGRGMAFSAGRQLAWGVGAAVVTFGVGRIIGVNIG